ncbi:MAG: FKBP-type peptidyl-prolyl cis-trans isomerase N-terminal domain-containing protein [Planctomycetota bacterium]
MNRNAVIALSLTAVTVGCLTGASIAQQAQPQATPTQSTTTATDPTSYAMGVDVARNVLDAIARDEVTFDRVSFFRGVADALNEQPLAFTDGQIRRALADLETEVATRQAQARLDEDPLFRLSAESNAEAGKAFRDRFAARDGVTLLPSGVLYESISQGSGDPAQGASAVSLVLTAATATGARFADRLPVDIELAAMLPAVADTVSRMTTGDRWIIVVPPEAAFGIAGHDTDSGVAIGPNETLVATVELIGVAP